MKQVVSTAFIIDYKGEPCVFLVQRVGNTEFSGKWALLPAGGVEQSEDIFTAMKRETNEELIILDNETRIDPLINTSIIIEKDIYEDYNNINKTFNMWAYYLNMDLDKVTICDGESYFGRPLDRLIAVIKLSEDFYGIVQPVALFESGIRFDPCRINLYGYQTPTLNWLRIKKGEIIEKIRDVKNNG